MLAVRTSGKWIMGGGGAGSFGSKTATAARSSHRNASTLAGSFYEEDHRDLIDVTMKVIEKEINPRCEEWEKSKNFPAHEVKKLF